MLFLFFCRSLDYNFPAVVYGGHIHKASTAHILYVTHHAHMVIIINSLFLSHTPLLVHLFVRQLKVRLFWGQATLLLFSR